MEIDLDYLKLILEVVIAASTVVGIVYGFWRVCRKHLKPFIEGKPFTAVKPAP